MAIVFLIIVSPTSRHTYLVSKIGDVIQNNRDLGSYTKTRTTIVIQVLRYIKYCLLNLNK